MSSETMEATLQRLYSGRTAFKDAVRVASTSNVTASGTQTIDGVALTAGERVLLTAQTTTAHNGVYVVASGTWARAADLSVNGHARLGMAIYVISGTANAGLWVLTSPTSGTISLGSTSLTFTKAVGSGAAASIAALEEPPQIVHTADGSLTFGSVNILTSVADGMTIPDVATNSGEYMVVVNAMAATTAVLTRSGSDVVVNGTSGTAYNLPAGETVVLRAGATGSNVYIEHGGSGGAASGTEAPTVSTIPQRTSAGVIRSVSYTAETNTDADRYVRGTTSDGTTLDVLRVEGAAVELGRKTADAYNRMKCTPAADGSALLMETLSSADAANPCTVKATTYKINVTSQKVADASDAYGQTYTPAAAATIVYGADLTSLTDRIAIKAAGAGAARYILGGLGAAGSANGQFFTGLENGNTVLGGLHGLHVGSLVGGVSDKLSVLTGTPGIGTSIFDVFAVATNSTRLQTPGSYAFGIFSANAVTIASNTGVTLSAATITLSGNDYLLNGGQYLSTPESIAFAASLTLNFNLSDGLVIGTLTANITTVTVTNAYGGSTKKVKVTMGGAGSYTIAWGSEFKFGATYSGTPDATVGHVTEWVFDVISSTEIRCVGKETFTS